MTKVAGSYFVVFLAAMMLSCDGGPSEPDGDDDAPIRVLTGGSLIDTIDAEPSTALVVDIRDAQIGMIVEFRSLDGTVLVGPPSGAAFGSEYATITAADGTVGTALKMGLRAGDGGVVVSVPALGITDTVYYTIEPGAGASVSVVDRFLIAEARDTTTVTVTDRGGNVVTDDWTILTDSVLTKLSGNRVTTGVAGIGVLRVGAHHLTVNVLPDATVLGIQGDFYGSVSEIVEFRLDGENRRVITEAGSTASPTRDPHAERWIYHREVAGAPSSWQLYTVGPDGASEQLDLPLSFQWSAWPRFTEDGQWIYFEGRRSSNDCIGVWRVNRALTHIDSILTFADADLRQPRVSPDGTRLGAITVACGEPLWGAGAIVVDFESGASERLVRVSSRLAWAPDSRRLAVMTYDHFAFARTHVLEFPGGVLVGTFPGGNRRSLDWDPESDWIITHETWKAIVVNTVTGTVLDTDLFDMREYEWQ